MFLLGTCLCSIFFLLITCGFFFCFLAIFKIFVSELDKTLSVLQPETVGVCGTCVARESTRASERLLLWTENFLCEGEGVNSLLEHEIIFRMQYAVQDYFKWKTQQLFSWKQLDYFPRGFPCTILTPPLPPSLKKNNGSSKINDPLLLVACVHWGCKKQPSVAFIACLCKYKGCFLWSQHW